MPKKAGRPEKTVRVDGLRPLLVALKLSPEQVKATKNPWTGTRYVSDGRTFDRVYESGECRSIGTLENIAGAVAQASGHAISQLHLTGEEDFDPSSDSAIWIPKNLGPARWLENNIEYIRCDFEDVRDPVRKARGKIYNLNKVPSGETLDGIQHWLRRHYEVSYDASDNNPNLISVRWCGWSHRKAEWYVVEQWIEGPRLSDILYKTKRERKGQPAPFTAVQIRAIALGILNGLESLHNAGYIMRALTPEKVLVSNDLLTPVIADFELTKLMGRGQTVSGDPNNSGWEDSYPFIAPEAWKNESGEIPVNAKADLYSWACVVLSMVEGYRLSTGRDLQDMRDRVQHADCFSNSLKDMIKNCLWKDPARRCASISELRQTFPEI